jgi:UDP-2,3-diacylglucosamine pyrophosphatase LpxH
MNRPPKIHRKIKVITSDMHLSAGRFLDGNQNPHEDFYFDREFIEFLEYFSTDKFGDGCEVELILNGDVLDFLNVPISGDFLDVVTEDIALEKLYIILKGHQDVLEALQSFVKRPGKRIIYNVGNHDLDLFFPKVKELLSRAIGGNDWTKDKIWINTEMEYIEYPEGIRIHHGNQFEAVHTTNYSQPLITENLAEPILYLPWGSLYVLKIINRLKLERDYIDKVKPAKLFVILGLLTDPFFTLKFLFLSMVYFLQTRFIYSPKRRATIRNTLAIMQQEITPFFGLEDDAKNILNQNPQINTVIFGHTHGPMQRFYADGRSYINTGTWTRMINLDFRHLGQATHLTFAFIEYDENNKPNASLQEWIGLHSPHKYFVA